MSAHTVASLPSSARNVLTGTASKYLVLAVNIGLGVFLLPFTIRHLGKAEYGLWMLVASMTYYFQLLDLGYGSGLVRHVTEADTRRDIPRVNEILSTFVVVYAGIGLVAAAGIAAIIAWVIPRFPNLLADQQARAQAILALMGLRVAVGFPMTVFGAVTLSRQRFALNGMVAVVVALANGAVTYLVLSRGHGLVMLVACTTAVALASYGAYAWTARLAFPEIRIRLSAFNPRLVREITSFSFYLFVINVGVQIAFNIDNVLIGAILGTSAVAVYTVAFRLADYQRQLCNQFHGLLFPVVVRFGTAGRTDALRDMLLEGTRVALALVVGVTICVIGFASPLIARWMGPGFDGSVAPLYVLAATGIVLVGQGPLGTILLGTGRHRLVAFTTLGEAVANLALSLALVRHYGIVGVAIGTAVPVFVSNLFILMPVACRQVGLSVTAFGRIVATAPVAAACPAVAVLLMLRSAIPPDSLAAIFGEATVVGTVYVATLLTALDRPVRTRYFRFLSQLLPSSAAGRVTPRPMTES